VKTPHGFLVAAVVLLSFGLAKADDDLGQSIQKAADQGAKKGLAAPPDTGGSAEELSGNNGNPSSNCKLPEVDESQVNDLWSRKVVLMVYDSAGSPTCPTLEKLSGESAYKDKVTFAKVSYKRFKDLGIKDRVGEKGTPTLNHFYLLDSAQPKHDFDSASPAGTKYRNVSYGVEEYFRATLWRCLNAAPTDPAPAKMPERVQCLPQCPSREPGWVCQVE
jgi:hypothetical protein